MERIKAGLKHMFFSSVLFFMFSVPPCLGLPSHRLISVAHIHNGKAESVDLLLSHESVYKTFYLNHPSRFVIDIENCYFQSVHSNLDVKSDRIDYIRISQFERERVRVVIDKAPNWGEININEINVVDGFKIQISLTSGNLKEPEIEIPFPLKKTSFSRKTKKTNKLFEKLSTDSENQSLDGLFTLPDNELIIIDDKEFKDGFLENGHSKFLVSGDLRNETAYRINNPRQFSKIETILNLKASGELSDNISYLIGSRSTYDAVFDLTDNYNQGVEDDQKYTVDLREAYIDLSLGKFDLRLGNQQIVWGQAIGLFFADIVNPKDLREYILPDLDQIRIPVPAVNLESYYDSLYFQFIFIPFPEFNEFGKRGAEFDFSRSLYDANADIILNETSDPSRSLDNSEVGGRISLFKNGWDMALFYFYDYYNFPVNYRSISVNPLGSLHPVTITYEPKYERIHRAGSTFSKEIMNAILKGEFIYSSNMFYQSSETSDVDGIIKSPSFDWLLGVDYTFLNALDTNFQIMQNIVLNYEADMMENKYSTSLSLWLKSGFFDDLIEPECFFVYSLNQTDWLFSPKVTYNYNTNFKFVLGTDFFSGCKDGDFGIFNGNDRIYLEILLIF